MNTVKYKESVLLGYFWKLSKATDNRYNRECETLKRKQDKL